MSGVRLETLIEERLFPRVREENRQIKDGKIEPYGLIAGDLRIFLVLSRLGWDKRIDI